jgi:hypothetical protein
MAWLCDWIMPRNGELGQVLTVPAQLLDRAREVDRLSTFSISTGAATEQISRGRGARASR